MVIERSLQILASMGVHLSPASIAEFSTLDQQPTFDAQCFASAPEQIQCIAVEIAKTESVFNAKEASFNRRVYSSDIYQSAPHVGVGHESHGDADCHLNLLVQDLRGVSEIEGSSSRCPPGHSAFVLLGVISPDELIRLIDQENPGIICCLFRQDEDWLSWIFSQEIQVLYETILRRKIVFRALQSRAIKSDLFALLHDDLFGFVGSAILVVNIADPLMLSVASVFRSSFLNGLRAKSGGPCVDEFMMMFHTRVNCDRRNLVALAPLSSPICTPLIVIGSGPSLDAALEDLRVLGRHAILISAGSSLAALLRAGIRPHFHVHVERGSSGELKDLYQGLLDEYKLDDFGDIIAVLPTSIDPDLPTLYRRVVMYARPAQTPVRAWPFLNTSVLQYEGPECLSAAFAFAMHLHPEMVFLFGCDFGSVAGSLERSAAALGKSSRNFPLQFAGNLRESVMTSPQMLLQISYMYASCSACPTNPQVFNLSDGIRLHFAKPLASNEAPLSGLVNGDVIDSSMIDDLYNSIIAPDYSLCSPSFGAPQIADAKQWINQWLLLADQAPSMTSFAVRLQASRLLSKRKYLHSDVAFSLFRGSLRDGFWLTAFAVDHYCRELQDIEYCWSSFSRFLESLLLEIDAIPSWLGVSDQ